MKASVREPKPQDWTSKTSLIISLGAFVVSAISVFINAGSARVNADAARTNATTAQLNNSSTLVSRRPIILVEEAKPTNWPSDDNVQDFARFDFKNYGSSPARDVVVEGKSEFKTKDEDPSFGVYPPPQFKGVVGAGMSFDQGIILPSLAVIKDESRLLYVHGRVRYRDMWNAEHYLEFCYKLDPNRSSFYACMKHNNVDQ